MKISPSWHEGFFRGGVSDSTTTTRQPGGASLQTRARTSPTEDAQSLLKCAVVNEALPRLALAALVLCAGPALGK